MRMSGLTHIDVKRILLIACILIQHAYGADEKDIATARGRDSSAKAASVEEEQQKDYDAAMARLPRLDTERMDKIIKTLREMTYPISFESLREKLGGKDALVWCCTYNRLNNKDTTLDKQTDLFFVANTDPLFGNYKLIVDYENFPSNGRPMMVSRARLCFYSPFGWRFAAESMDDYLHVGSWEKANPAKRDSTPPGNAATGK